MIVANDVILNAVNGMIPILRDLFPADWTVQNFGGNRVWQASNGVQVIAQSNDNGSLCQQIAAGRITEITEPDAINLVGAVVMASDFPPRGPLSWRPTRIGQLWDITVQDGAITDGSQIAHMVSPAAAEWLMATATDYLHRHFTAANFG